METNYEKFLIEAENEVLRNGEIPIHIVFDDDILHIKSHLKQFYKTIHWITVIKHIIIHLKNIRHKNKENLNGITFNSMMKHLSNKERW